MGGKAPVFVNRNPPIREAHALMDGDEVALGNVMFVFDNAAPKMSTTEESQDAVKDDEGCHGICLLEGRAVLGEGIGGSVGGDGGRAYSAARSS